MAKKPVNTEPTLNQLPLNTVLCLQPASGTGKVKYRGILVCGGQTEIVVRRVRANGDEYSYGNEMRSLYVGNNIPDLGLVFTSVAEPVQLVASAATADDLAYWAELSQRQEQYYRLKQRLYDVFDVDTDHDIGANFTAAEMLELIACLDKIGEAQRRRTALTLPKGLE